MREGLLDLPAERRKLLVDSSAVSRWRLVGGEVRDWLGADGVTALHGSVLLHYAAKATLFRLLGDMPRAEAFTSQFEGYAAWPEAALHVPEVQLVANLYDAQLLVTTIAAVADLGTHSTAGQGHEVVQAGAVLRQHAHDVSIVTRERWVQQLAGNVGVPCLGGPTGAATKALASLLDAATHQQQLACGEAVVVPEQAALQRLLTGDLDQDDLGDRTLVLLTDTLAGAAAAVGGSAEGSVQQRRRQVVDGVRALLEPGRGVRVVVRSPRVRDYATGALRLADTRLVQLAHPGEGTPELLPSPDLLLPLVVADRLAEARPVALLCLHDTTLGTVQRWQAAGRLRDVEALRAGT